MYEVGMTRDAGCYGTNLSIAQGRTDIGQAATLTTTDSKYLALVHLCLREHEVNSTTGVEIDIAIVVLIVIA